MTELPRKYNIDGVRVTRSVRKKSQEYSHSIQDSEIKAPVSPQKVAEPLKRRAKAKNSYTLGGKKNLDRNIHTKLRSTSWLKPVLRILIPVLLALTAVGLLLNQYDSAIVRVEPFAELADIDMQISTKKSAQEGELEFSIIAISETNEVQLAADIEIPVERYASGEIRIFNDYSSSPQRLSAETRFEAVDGKIFRLGDEELVIPGKQGDTPGEVTALVYADEPGEEYNIDVTDFSIPGFLELGLEEKYAGIYALSTQKFSGGYEGSEPAISQSLKDEQQKVLQEQARKSLTNRLAAEKTPGMLVVDNSARIELKESIFQQEEGEQEGVLRQDATIYSLLLNKKDLGQYLAQQTLDLDQGQRVALSQDTQLRPRYEGLAINYETIRSADIAVSGEVLFIWEPQEKNILESLLGMEKEQLESYLESEASLESINVRNHPRWRSTLPYDPENISIDVIR